MRPPDEKDMSRGLCLDVTGPTSLSIACKPEAKSFAFDHVAGMETTQVVEQFEGDGGMK